MAAAYSLTRKRSNDLPSLRRTHAPVATSQTAAVCPGPSVSKAFPSAEKASWSTRFCPVSSWHSFLPVAVSHKQTLPPREAATVLPSEERAAWQLSARSSHNWRSHLWAISPAANIGLLVRSPSPHVKRRISLPVASSHKRTVLSLPAVKSALPSGA